MVVGKNRGKHPAEAKRPPETGGLKAKSQELPRGLIKKIYSAATLRGGSSAPESWISAT